MPLKCILILLDGLGDRSYEELDFKTPLQAAKTPTLDRLAELGANGLFHAGLMGEAYPSETAHFLMFGYDLSEFPGRGALEALGANIELSPQDVSLLIHFVHLTEKDGYFYMEDETKAVPQDEIADLLASVGRYEKDGFSAEFVYMEKHRGVLIIKGGASPYITDSDPITIGCPLSDIKPWKRYETDGAAVRTAEFLKAYTRFVYDRLGDHPVNLHRKKHKKPLLNGIVIQRAGRLTTLSPFRQRYGLRGLCIASGAVYKGLSAVIGLDFRKVDDTQNPGRDLAQRLGLARELSGDYDFIHIHTKAPDEAAHTKDPILKMKIIESIDKGLTKAVSPFLDNNDTFIVITGDHSTPSHGLLVHSGEPSPITFVGPGVRRDRIRRFDEVSVGGGALGIIRGRELILSVLNHLDKAKLQGLMDSPEDFPYYPSVYEPFKR